MRMLVVAALSAALLSGCSFDRPLVSDEPGRPVTVRVSGVPFHGQDGFRCGPAAMAMMLGWSGATVTPAELEGRFYGQPGDPAAVLVDAALGFGRLPYPIRGTDALMRELAAGHPVLILQNLGVASEPMWNCSVAIGFDRAARELTLHAGDQPSKRMGMRLFERLWADTDEWGLVVLRAGELPATAAKDTYLAAAKALEKAGRHWEAVMAFDAALSKWSTDPGALTGLASSLYLLGDPQGAADAYRAAASIAPDPGPALNALAHVLAEMGRRDEAVSAARQAVATGGPRKAGYEQTLKDVAD